MNKLTTAVLISLATLFGYSQATIALNYTFGVAYSSDGTTTIPDDTLWVMIVDDGDGILPGGLEINSSLKSNEDEAAIAADFNGVTIAKGTLIGNDRIFDFGGMNGSANFGLAGVVSGAANYSFGSSQNDDFSSADVGKAFGFYWFPGKSINGNLSLGTVAQVGGVSDQTSTTPTERMVIPSDGSTESPSATTSDLGGTFSDVRFTAIEVPQSGYQLWRDASFSQIQIDAGDAAPTADPDQDGLVNLLEYATASLPLSASPGPLSILRSGESAELKFQRLSDPELRYRVEATDDLGLSPWPDVVFESSRTENIEELVSVSENIDGTARFFRLEVEFLVDATP